MIHHLIMAKQPVLGPPTGVWSVNSIGFSGNWVNIRYGNGIFAAVSESGDFTASVNAESGWTNTYNPNGSNWIGLAHTLIGGVGRFTSVDYTVNRRIQVGQVLADGATMVSMNTYTMTTHGQAGGSNWFGLGSNGTRLVAVAANTTVARRSDNAGQSWADCSMPASGSWNNVAWIGGNNWMIMRGGLAVARSTDNGANFGSINMPNNRAWANVLGNGSGVVLAVANASGVIARSTDYGATWNEVALPRNQDWQAMAYGNGKFLVIARNSRYAAVSADNGLNWTESDIGVVAAWYNATFGGGRFAAIATAGQVATVSF